MDEAPYERIGFPLIKTLEVLGQQPVGRTEKGFGSLADGRVLTATSLANEGISLHGGQLTFPILTIEKSALQHNVRAMAQYCDRLGVKIAPHGKTTMSPELIAQQLEAGAWGITVATVSQLQTLYTFGVRRLLLANELVDCVGIAWLGQVLENEPDLNVYCYVDSVRGVQILDKVLSQHLTARQLPVLVELGFEGGRTGVRSHEQALRIAASAASTGTLRVAGVAGYEAGVGPEGPPTTPESVARYVGRLRNLLQDIWREGLSVGEQIVSAGGSAFFDVVASGLTTGWDPGLRPTVLLRSGAYVTHDNGHYAEVSPARRRAPGVPNLRPALKLWCHVLSRPEPELAILSIGRRDVAFDAGLPVVSDVRRGDDTRGDTTGMVVTALNDQHAYVHLPAATALEPGDAVGLGISHPCTTLDKWRVIPVVDDTAHIVGAIHTFF